MGEIVHVPSGTPIGHKHEEPPAPGDYPRGTIWECSCGRQRRLDDDQREGWIWIWTNPNAPVAATPPVGGGVAVTETPREPHPGRLGVEPIELPRYPCCVHCEVDHDCVNDPCPHAATPPVGGGQ